MPEHNEDPQEQMRQFPGLMSHMFPPMEQAIGTEAYEQLVEGRKAERDYTAATAEWQRARANLWNHIAGIMAVLAVLAIPPYIVLMIFLVKVVL